MKKSSVLGFILWVIIFVIGFTLLFIFLQHYTSYSDLWSYDKKLPFILFYAGALLFGLVLNAFIFELAHLLGAKVGNYKIVSVNILGLQFEKKENNKSKVFFNKYDGLTGETRILPIEDNGKKCNPVPYNIFGSIFYGVELLILIVFFIIFKEDYHGMSDWAYFALCIAVVGGIILIYNIMPFQLDTMTDGFRLRLISNKKNKNAYNEYLLAEAGKAPKESSSSDNKDEVKQNAFSNDIKLNSVYVDLSNNLYKEAEQKIDELLNDAKENPKLLLQAKAQKAFIVLLTREKAEAKRFYDKELSLPERKEMSEDVTMPSIRAYVMMSGLLDKSQSECIYVLKRAYKAYKRTPKGMQKIEVKLLNIAIDAVLKEHPSWELEIYKMIEVD